MGVNTASLERLALELAHAIQPLQDLLEPGFFVRLGAELPHEASDDAGLLGALADARSAASAMAPDAQALADALAADDSLAVVGAGAALIGRIRGLAASLAAVGEALEQAASALDPETQSRLAEVGERMAARCFEAMLVEYLGTHWPSLAIAMDVLGLLDRPPPEHERLEIYPARTEQTSLRLHAGRLPRLLGDPLAHLREVYGWGDPDFDARVLLEKTQSLLVSLGVPASIDDAGSEPVLEAFAFAALADRSTTPPGMRFELALPGDVELQQAIPVAAPWRATLATSAQFAAGAAIRLQSPFAIDVQPGSGDFALQIGATLEAASEGGEPLVLFGVAGASSLQARRLRTGADVAAAFGSDGGSLVPRLHAGIEGGQLVVDATEGDGFVGELLGDRRVELDFELAAEWSVPEGLRLQGSVAGETFVPARLALGPVGIDGVHASVATIDGAIEAVLKTQVTATIGPLVAVVDGVGIATRLGFPDDGGGRLGIAELDVAFRAPDGVGLSVDARGVLSGGGFLRHDPVQQSYAGVMQLSVQQRFSVTAFGLLATRLPGGARGYSLLVFITAQDFQPVPLGLGFNLLGIGGMLGINRSFDLEVLRAGMRNATLGAMLFPRDPVANAPAILQALASAFPARRGCHLVGLLVKIGWATPTLILFDLALVLEFGARRRLLAFGRVSALLPRRDNDLVRLNLDAIGAVDFDAGTVAIDALLVDSRLVHKYALTGAAAFRAGDDSGFLLSVGGFNPRFAPPAGVPELPRVAIALGSGSNPRFRCAAYFAITSNTLQFGARAELYAEALGFSLQGDVGFDVLVTRSPLQFLADFDASVQLKRGSRRLFKVAVAGTLQGPRPLRLSGKASFEIFWCDFTVRFDATLIGGERPPLPPAVDVQAELIAALRRSTSWRTIAPPQAAHGVSLRRPTNEAALVLDPLGRLAVSQDVVPLNTGRDIDVFGGAPVAGARRFGLAVSLEGLPLAPIASLQAPFAPAQFFAMSDDEKLAAPSFELRDAGVVVGSEAASFDAAQIAATALDYEAIVIDELAAPPKPAPAHYTLPAERLERFAASGAAGRAPLRRIGRTRYRRADDEAAESAVRLLAPSWAIAPLLDATAPEPDPGIRTYSDHLAALARLNRGAARYQLVPSYELES
ncbi:MAG: hypothetical protein GX644_02460 [Limnobacter sp.]|nr:hypothetical protein [Limnobacter sp.]